MSSQVELAPRQTSGAPGSSLSHTCRDHPWPECEPCGPACVALCGYALGENGTEMHAYPPGVVRPNACVVCESLFVAMWGFQ